MRFAAGERPIVEADFGENNHDVVGADAGRVFQALRDAAIQCLLGFGGAAARKKDLDKNEISRALGAHERRIGDQLRGTVFGDDLKAIASGMLSVSRMASYTWSLMAAR